jgi:hypothetical protein
MIAIGTKNLSPLVYSGLFDLKKFLKTHPEIEYLETSLEYDNDSLLKDYIPETTKVISKIPYIKNLDITVEFNKLALGVEDNQLYILLNAKEDWEENKDELEKIKTKYRIGLYNVTEVNEILIFSDYCKPEMIEVEINPLLYPKSVLDYATENDIKIISHGIFGGEIWAAYLQNMFPKGFLYDFARYNSDIQIIPGNDIYFLYEILGRKENEEEEKLCKYSKDINKLPALIIPPQKIHGVTKLEISGVIKAAVECGSGSDVYRMGEYKPEVKAPEIFWEDEELETKDPGILGSLHRYHAPVFLDKKYNPGWWKKIYIKIAPDFWVIKLIPRHWYFGWIAKEHVFWLISGKLIKIPLQAHQNLINDNNINI